MWYFPFLYTVRISQHKELHDFNTISDEIEIHTAINSPSWYGFIIFICGSMRAHRHTSLAFHFVLIWIQQQANQISWGKFGLVSRFPGFAPYYAYFRLEHNNIISQADMPRWWLYIVDNSDVVMMMVMSVVLIHITQYIAQTHKHKRNISIQTITKFNHRNW